MRGEKAIARLPGSVHGVVVQMSTETGRPCESSFAYSFHATFRLS